MCITYSLGSLTKYTLNYPEKVGVIVTLKPAIMTYADISLIFDHMVC